MFLLVGALQVMLIPFAAPAVALTYVLGSTLPLAWRRTHPIPSSLLSTLSWLISTDGYPVAGYVVVMLATGKARQIHALMWLIAALFVLFFAADWLSANVF